MTGVANSFCTPAAGALSRMPASDHLHVGVAFNAAKAIIVIVGKPPPASAIAARFLPRCDWSHSSLLCHFCSQEPGWEGRSNWTLRAIAAHLWPQQSFPASPGAEHGTIGGCVTAPITLSLARGPIRVNPDTSQFVAEIVGKGQHCQLASSRGSSSGIAG